MVSCKLPDALSNHRQINLPPTHLGISREMLTRYAAKLKTIPRWTFLQIKRPSSKIWQTRFHNSAYSQYGDDPSSTGGGFPRMKPTACAEGPLRGNNRKSVNKVNKVNNNTVSEDCNHYTFYFYLISITLCKAIKPLGHKGLLSMKESEKERRY